MVTKLVADPICNAYNINSAPKKKGRLHGKRSTMFARISIDNACVSWSVSNLERRVQAVIDANGNSTKN